MNQLNLDWVPKELREEYRARIEAAPRLWQLLDDLSALSDACKDNDAAFRQGAMRLAERRSSFAESDGYKLTWKRSAHHVCIYCDCKVHYGDDYIVVTGHGVYHGACWVTGVRLADKMTPQTQTAYLQAGNVCMHCKQVLAHSSDDIVRDHNRAALFICPIGVNGAVPGHIAITHANCLLPYLDGWKPSRLTYLAIKGDPLPQP